MLKRLALLTACASVVLGMPGWSRPGTLENAENPLLGITEETRYFNVSDIQFDLHRDWVVDLRNPVKSQNLKNKAFFVNVTGIPQIGTEMHLVYEEWTWANRKVGGLVRYIAQVPIRGDMLIIPAIYFPESYLGRGVRLLFRIPTGRIKKVVMVDKPELEQVKVHQFDFWYHLLKQDIAELNEDKHDVFRVDALGSDTFMETYKIIMDSKYMSTVKTNKLNVLGVDPTAEPSRVTYAQMLGVGFASLESRFFTLLSREIASPARNLFVKDEHTDALNIVPQSVSGMGYQTATNYFRFVGRIIGLAIANRQPLDATFSKPILQAIVSDPSYLITELGTMLFAHMNVQKAQVSAQLNCLRFGVWDIVPRDLLVLFDTEQLGWMISGRQDMLTLDNFREWVDVKQSVSNEVTNWFWSYVESLPALESMLEVITSSPKLPPNGFAGYAHKLSVVSGTIAQDKSISEDEFEPCGIRILDKHCLFIPNYSSKKILIKQFDRAMALKAGVSQ